MDKDELSKILHTMTHEHNFRMEILEKDYYLTVILNDLHNRLSDNLIFKGGTLLNKVHLNYHRLSKDKIDLLTRQVETDLIPVIRIDEVFDLNKTFNRFNKILGPIL